MAGYKACGKFIVVTSLMQAMESRNYEYIISEDQAGRGYRNAYRKHERCIRQQLLLGDRNSPKETTFREPHGRKAASTSSRRT